MNMRRKTARTVSKAFSIALILLALCGPGKAQNSVALSPSLHPQFVDGTGKLLSGGFLYFYAAGTTTPLATYADNLGTIANPNPVQLDATGAASNGSTQIQIWLLNNSYKVCAYSSALVLQWCWDNISAYQTLTALSALTFNNVTVDPTGFAGEIWYRSDLGCLRLYTTFPDCFVTLTGTQSLTNKTLVNPVISSSTGAVLSSPNINGTIVTGPPATYLVMANDLATGTTLNKLAKINPTGLAGFAILPLISDTGGVTGIVVSGAGTTGNATIQQNGSASCIFDNAVTSGDYVQISSSVAGDCHDAGATYPVGGQVLGRLLATNAAPGTYLIDLFGPEIKFPSTLTAINAANLTTQAANIGVTTLTTPAANGYYRASCYSVITQAATTSSVLPNCNITFTDADSNVVETLAATTTNNTNTIGGIAAATNGPVSFYAKTGVAIQFSTVNYSSVGATPMQYAIHVRLEGPF